MSLFSNCFPWSECNCSGILQHDILPSLPSCLHSCFISRFSYHLHRIPSTISNLGHNSINHRTLKLCPLRISGLGHSSASFASSTKPMDGSSICSFRISSFDLVVLINQCKCDFFCDDFHDMASVFPCKRPLRCSIIKLYSWRASSHQANWPSGFLKLYNHVNELWSVLKVNGLPSR